MNEQRIALWRERLEAHNRAADEMRRAKALLDQALIDLAHDPAPSAGGPCRGLGVLLAQRRFEAAARRATEATFRLTGGRPLEEILWLLPDDL